jgi:hypothetical protein
MKSIVRRELEREGYEVMEEPPFPPVDWVSWASYRPDLLGFRVTSGAEEVVVVECETRPSTMKMMSKNHGSLSFQPTISGQGSMRKLLAVPQGRLRGLDMVLRREWEIWVLGREAPLTKIPRLPS